MVFHRKKNNPGISGGVRTDPLEKVVTQAGFVHLASREGSPASVLPDANWKPPAGREGEVKAPESLTQDNRGESPANGDELESR